MLLGLFGVGLLVLIGFCIKRYFGTFRSDTRRISERSSQDSVEESPVNQRDVVDQMTGCDEPDAATQTEQIVSHQSIQQNNYKKVQHSLEQLFQCVYTQLVLPWYIVPEDRSSQPLYSALLIEYNLAVDMIVSKVTNLDLRSTVLNGIPLITQHLRSAKQSDGSSAFSNKTDEINVLRDFSKALIHNLLPRHIWEQSVYFCVLREILATRAFDLVVMLSDPDTLNHLIVTLLEVPTNPPSIELQNADKEDSPSSMPSEGIDTQQDDKTESISEENKPKKKGNRLRSFFSNIKIKRQRQKKNKSVRVCAALETDGESSDDDRVNLDDECYSCKKLFYEVWKTRKWNVTVTNVQKDTDELLFTIHLEDSDDLDALKWNMQKTKSEITEFYNCCKDPSHLPSIETIINNSATEWNEDEVRTSLENFLQGLVTDQMLGCSELVFTFFCPLSSEDEQYDAIWDLLYVIAPFLNLGQEDDQRDEQKLEEKQNDETHQHELNETQPMNENTLRGLHKEAMGDMLDKNCEDSLNPGCLKEKEEMSHTHNADHSVTSTESDDDYLQHPTGHSTRQAACLSLDSDNDSTDSTSSIITLTKTAKPAKKQKPDSTVIFDLLKEISGKSVIIKVIKFFKSIPKINKTVSGYLEMISLSEDQIADCIDNLCKLMNAPQQTPRSSEERNETKQQALQLINFSTRYFHFVINKEKWENTFQIFQNAEQNKKLVYNLMSHLLKELMPGESGLDVTARLNVKHPVQ